jgi:hypothetical protein
VAAQALVDGEGLGVHLNTFYIVFQYINFSFSYPPMI